MRRMAGYPRGFYGFMIAVFMALVASGLMLLPSMLQMRLDWESPLHVGGDLRLASAALHCVAAFLAMGLLGALSTVHMRAGWHRRRNRVSGVSLLVLLLVLMLTAVGVYYFGDENLSRWSSLIHTVVGLLLVAVVLWHGVIGHRLYNRRVQRHRRRSPQAVIASPAEIPHSDNCHPAYPLSATD